MPEEFNNLVHVKNNTCQAAYIGNLGDVKRCIEKNDYNGAIKKDDTPRTITLYRISTDI